ncbi:hypothetical protein PSD17_14710 [Pseudonocardia sp. D17]|nr:hypothetical protein PSD17_14710 [Pseudonocardia sp. D17]
MGALARGDDGDWPDLVADLLRAPTTRLPTERIGWLLVEMLAAAGCSYWGHDLDGESVDEGRPPEYFAPYRAEMLHHATNVAPTRHPLLRYCAATGDIRAMQVCESPPPSPTRPSWRSSASVDVPGAGSGRR